MIAEAEVNLGEHFGDAFREKSVDLEISKYAQGSNVRVLKYSATISCKKEKNRAVFAECVHWNEVENQIASGGQSQRTGSENERGAGNAALFGASTTQHNNRTQSEVAGGQHRGDAAAGVAAASAAA